MTTTDIRTLLAAEIVRIAPDLDPGGIVGTDHLQDDLDLDSMDILSLVSALESRLSITIPETDYRRLATFDRAVAYLSEKAG